MKHRINKAKTKVEMPLLDADIRKQNFEEVALGYTEEMALEEAMRCLDCKHKPCVDGCPVNIAIPEFITHIKNREFEEAYQKILETNALPAICGRVCPQELQCEKVCVRAKTGEAVAIGNLERFVADRHMQDIHRPAEVPSSKGLKVAVVGSGPAGLICAADMAKLGYEVTVFEAFHALGGVLVYGIPEFRLPKDVVDREIENLRELGVKLKTNMVIGRAFTIDDLFEDGFQAVFIGSGAGLPSFMEIPGENLNAVYSANDYLTRINLMRSYDDSYDTPITRGENVAVIGGGNVAMDAARAAKRLGAENVYVVYRRTEAEMPARIEEVIHAKEEGILIKTLRSPIEILGDERGYVRALRCVEMVLGETDQEGRRQVSPRDDSDFTLEVDTVIVAIGTSPNPLIRITTPGLETEDWGGFIVDPVSKMTSREGVFAGGDAVTGSATVIQAMGAGKQAALGMDKYIREKLNDKK